MHTVIIDASSTNIPASFDNTAGSLVIDGSPSSGQLAVLSTATEFIAYTVGDFHQRPVSTITDNRNQGVIPRAPTDATSAYINDEFKITRGNKLYIRSLSGSAITSGLVYITLL